MKLITIEDLKSSIRDVPDFPKPGILFKDLTTAFKRPEILNFIVEDIYEHYKNAGISKVVGIESRGFIAGAAVAQRLNAGFVPIRKPGKLPAHTFSQSYDLEYGQDTIEIHTDALESSDVVLLHDDLLATGGTALAAIELLRKFNVKKVYTNFIVELTFLEGLKRLNSHSEVYSMLKY